jgi:hypothetical protein
MMAFRAVLPLQLRLLQRVLMLSVDVHLQQATLIIHSLHIYVPASGILDMWRPVGAPSAGHTLLLQLIVFRYASCRHERECTQGMRQALEEITAMIQDLPSPQQQQQQHKQKHRQPSPRPKQQQTQQGQAQPQQHTVHVPVNISLSGDTARVQDSPSPTSPGARDPYGKSSWFGRLLGPRLVQCTVAAIAAPWAIITRHGGSSRLEQ